NAGVLVEGRAWHGDAAVADAAEDESAGNLFGFPGAGGFDLERLAGEFVALEDDGFNAAVAADFFGTATEHDVQLAVFAFGLAVAEVFEHRHDLLLGLVARVVEFGAAGVV